MRTLLHACCGPCSLASTRALAEEGVQFDIDYTNSNIHPVEEHAKRLEALREYVAEPLGVQLHVGSYDVDEWERVAGVHGTNREERCRACYRMRFQEVAQRASELGYDAICTTLTISPYQYTQVILEELEKAASERGLAALLKDFSPLYEETTQQSIQLGMYRQNYCGCRFSIAEAARDREQRKVLRKMKKKLQRLEEDIIDQIKEYQIKLGFASEKVRLYYKQESLAELLGMPGASSSQVVDRLNELHALESSPLGQVRFGTHEDRVEVLVPPQGVEYVHAEVPTPAFLVDLIDLFFTNHHPSQEEIVALFAKHSPKYELQVMPEGSDFDYSLHFKNPQIDSHYYCFKEEMGHTIYHRFMAHDYERLMAE